MPTLSLDEIKKAVDDIIGTKGDNTIQEYVISCLEDDTFEFGEEGEEAFHAFGEMLVGAECLPNLEVAREACRKLAAKLGGSKTSNAKQAFRSLEGGPVLMDELNRVTLHASETFSGRNAIQTPFEEFRVGANLPQVSEKELAKLRKREEAEEKKARAALAAHQAQAAERAAGAMPTIIRNSGGGGSRDVHLENFNLSNGGQDLLEDASLLLAFGRRYGLVGRNGTGKTTLLRAMAGHQIKGIPSNCQILHVEQEVVGDDRTVLQAVLETDTERTALLAEEALLTAELGTDPSAGSGREDGLPTASANGGPGGEGDKATRLQAVYKRLQEIDADGAEARAAAILAGLSFTPDMQVRATKTFSGGWRMRVALARALFVEPDILLLDEPTNHLDLHAVLWLEDYLLKWPKTVLVVSHAREFLNTVCTDIIHLLSRKLTQYRGNYDTFEKTAAERLRNAKKASEGIDRQRRHMQAFVDKFRYNAKRASLVQSRIKAIERLGTVEVTEEDPEYIFRFPQPEEVAPPIIAFVDVAFGYPKGPQLYHNLNFGIDMRSRLAIVGPNGIGKSTLLNLISGGLEPTSGHVTRSPKVRMATFAQHHVDGLDLALTPLTYMKKSFPQSKEQELRSHLGSFGIGGELALQAMYTLSGGQKSRVAFAKVTYTQPHILLLDEPSNHLDIDAVRALIEGLNQYKGGVLMVSHDQHLIEASVNQLWEVEHGTVTPFSGDFQDYKKKLRDRMSKGP